MIVSWQPNPHIQRPVVHQRRCSRANALLRRAEDHLAIAMHRGQVRSMTHA